MTKERVLTKNYRWMVISEDGLLKTPKSKYGEKIFRHCYSTEEEAIADYQRHIDDDLEFPYSAVLVPEYNVDYVF